MSNIPYFSRYFNRAKQRFENAAFQKNASLDPQERVLLGLEGKCDEFVSDRREAREQQCAVDELLDDHRRKECRAAKP